MGSTIGERSYRYERVLVDSDSDRAEARKLSGRIRMLDQLVGRWDTVANVRPRASSEIAMDDLCSDWGHLSTTVHHAIHVAFDNLSAFRQLVQPSPDDELVLPQSAHYPLLRAALEASSLAMWILAPDDPAQRITRVLRNAAAELADEDRLALCVINSLEQQPGTATRAEIDKLRKWKKSRHRKHADQIKKVSTRFGFAAPVGDRHVVGYAEIVREATASIDVDGSEGEVLWRLTSGLTHPSLMRALSHSSIERLSQDPDGVINARISTDITMTRATFDAAFAITSAAVERFGLRKIKPANPDAYPPDVS